MNKIKITTNNSKLPAWSRSSSCGCQLACDTNCSSSSADLQRKVADSR